MTRLLAIYTLATFTAVGCDVRVLTWNTHRSPDLPHLGALIRSARPDLVALQEVDGKSLRELERLTGLRGVFGTPGNAVLVQGQLLGSRLFGLPKSESNEQRSLLLVEVRPYRCSLDLSLLATQFDPKEEEDRLDSAEQVNADISLPAILAGDLAAPKGDLTLGVLQQKWTSVAENILVRPAARWKVVETKELAEKAVLAVLTLLPE